VSPPPFDPAARDRFLTLDGCHNFRAVTGWQAIDGRRLAPGRLFRADGLDQLSDADHARLRPLGITHALDLRASAEIARSPSRWPDDARPLVWSGAESAAEADITGLMARPNLDATELRQAMIGVYARFADDLAEAVNRTAEAVLDPAAGAVLIHCTAGKDRTGFVTAALLHAIGIRDGHVLADYLLSNASFAAACQRFNSDGRLDAVEARAPGAIAVLVGVHPEYLASSHVALETACGTIGAWLQERAGIDAAKRRALADRLLV
jgi:protein-tyrosine phosphatase